MFTSIRTRLASIIEEYDKYGEYRINALKGTYAFFMLSLVYMIYDVPHPYFNFFYLPLTALTAEMAGETVKSKYWLFFHATMGSIIAVFLFNILAPYPIFFAFFVFLYSLLHYIIALHYIKNIFLPIPIVLSLAIYSLAYGEIYTDAYMAFNNALVSLVAMIIIIGALVLFPCYYYLKAWRRAYILLLKQILNNFVITKNNQPNQSIATGAIQGHMIKVVKYSRLLSHRFPIFSILKTNFLVNDLRVLSCVIDQDVIKATPQELDSLINNLHLLIVAIVKKSPCMVSNEKNGTLQKMIHSWNYLCSQI